MIYLLGLIVLAGLGYVIYVQFTKTPAEDSMPKRAIAALTGAAMAAGAAVKTLFGSGAAPSP